MEGKPEDVLMDITEYHEQIKLLNLQIILDEAEEDIKNNRVRPVEEYFSELDKS